MTLQYHKIVEFSKTQIAAETGDSLWYEAFGLDKNTGIAVMLRNETGILFLK